MNSINYAPRVSDPALGGGALLDVGIYPITYAFRLFGIPHKVSCVGFLKNGIDTGEEVELTYPNGKNCSISTSTIDFKGLEKKPLLLPGQKGFFLFLNIAVV